MITSFVVHMALVLCDFGGHLDKDVHTDAEKMSRFIWAGVRDGRGMLRQCVFRAHGTYTADCGEHGNADGPVEIFGASDFDNNLFRFDRFEPQVVSESKREMMPARIGGRWVMTPTKSLHWVDVPGVITVALTHPQLPKGSPIGMFDVRSIGLMNWNANSTAETFDSVLIVG